MHTQTYPPTAATKIKIVFFPSRSHFYPEDGVSMFSWNVGSHKPDRSHNAEENVKIQLVNG
jgi:hypothetical protein